MPPRLPLLLLDVDGVLNLYAAPCCPPGYTEHELFPGEEAVRVCAAHGQWLAELAIRFQLVWATAWGAEANRLIDTCLRWAEGIAGESPRARSGKLCLRIGQFVVLNDSSFGR